MIKTDLTNTKVLLLGYTGYIGATVAKVLLEKNIKVICMCTIKENKKFQYFPLQYNDKLTNYSSK